MSDNQTQQQQTTGGEPPAWTAQLESELQSNETLTRHESISDLGKAYLELEARVKDSVRIPGEDATDEERREFFAKLGRPETPEGYQFKRPELPEGFVRPEEVEQDEKTFAAHAHELGLTQAQAQALYDFYAGLMTKSYERSMQEQARALEALKGEWGQQFQERVELAHRAAKALGGDEFIDYLEQSRMGDNPHLVRAFYEAGRRMAEDTLHDTGFSPPKGRERERTESGRPMLDFPSMRGQQ